MIRAGAALETVLGAVVLVAAVTFTIFAQSRLDAGPGGSTYDVNARFSSVGDLSRGAEVRLAGVPIGTVSEIDLESDTYFARVSMRVSEDVSLPEDSTAKIAVAGLLGGTFIEIEPGGSEEMLESGEEIDFTQGAVDLMDLVGQAIMNRGSSSSETP